MVSTHAARWALCGTGMKIQQDGFRVDKNPQSIEVVFEGDCKYFAVGVAKASVPLDDSLRRLPSGSAWFLLNKVKQFELVHSLNLLQGGLMAFNRRDDHVIGELQNLPDDDLRFCCYMDGKVCQAWCALSMTCHDLQGSSCMIMEKSAGNHESAQAEDLKEVESGLVQHTSDMPRSCLKHTRNIEC
eukprot:764091-Hanusia_phi.AAC.23